MHFTFLGPFWVTFIIYTTATLSSAYNDDSYTDDGANYPDGSAYDEGKGNEDYGGGGGGRGSEKGGTLNSGGKGGGGDGGDDHGSVDGAINSKHTVSFKQISTHSEPAKTPIVDINSGPLALKIRFNSHSSNIDAIQNHYGSPGQVKKSSSIDQPDILIHTVKRPVIQEIKEYVTPYRKRVQQLLPTIEKIETIIATGNEDGGFGGGGHGGGHGGGGKRYMGGGGHRGYAKDGY